MRESDSLSGLQASFSDKYSSRTQSAVFVAVRIALVLLIALVAAGVPGFGLFISLIGSLACASLSFIIPALCHLILFRTDINW
jgi:amino acid permease